MLLVKTPLPLHLLLQAPSRSVLDALTTIGAKTLPQPPRKVLRPFCRPSLSTSTFTSRPFYTTTAVLKMKESEIKRNPHPDFKGVEASRPPPGTRDATFKSHSDARPLMGIRQRRQRSRDRNNEDEARHHRPVRRGPRARTQLQAPDQRRGAPSHRLRVDRLGRRVNHQSCAPFSYFQVINHDPPLFIIGFASSLGRAEQAKHTPPQPQRHGRVHHQHHLGALHRGRQQHERGCAVRGQRVGGQRAHARL
ncbi:hypothetical protein OPQ81_008088 [Rhizoctonia solani]|nr:hypothetical protein OPQ81_008088 [Rhizoctonia solani]